MAERTVARAQAVLDRAAKMRTFKPGWFDARPFDRQIRTPGHVDTPFSVNHLPQSMLIHRGKAEIPLNKVRTEQPTVSVAEVKAKIAKGGSVASSPHVIRHNGLYYTADGNHGFTADRALGKKTATAQVFDINGKLLSPVISKSAVRAAGRATSMIASPLLVGANASLAYQGRKAAGGSTLEATGDAVLAGGATAASGMVIGSGLRTAANWGFKAAASTAARALVPLSIAGHAGAYGFAAWQRGESGAGIAKAAAWGGINGVLPIDATVSAVKSFNQADSKYSHGHQGMGHDAPTNAEHGPGRKGWSNKARAMSAASRGVQWNGPDE